MTHLVTKIALLAAVAGLAACDNLRDGGSSSRELTTLPDSATASDDFLREFAVKGGAKIGYSGGLVSHINAYRNEAGEDIFVTFLGGEDGAGVLEVRELSGDGKARQVAMGEAVDAAPEATYTGVVLSSHQVKGGEVVDDRGFIQVMVDTDTGAANLEGIAYSSSNSDDSFLTFEGEGAFTGSEFSAGDVVYKLNTPEGALGIEATGSVDGRLVRNGETPALVGDVNGRGDMRVTGSFIAEGGAK